MQTNSKSPARISSSISHNANDRLRKIVWLSTILLVAAYIAGIIHSGYISAQREARFAQVRLSSQVQEQRSQIVSEILMEQEGPLTQRLLDLERSMTEQTNLQEICIQLTMIEGVASHKTCPNDATAVKIQIPIAVGTRLVGVVHLQYQFAGYSAQAVMEILPSLLLVLMSSILSTRLLFRLAEKDVIGPFAATIRAKERDTAVAETIHMLAHDVRRPFSMMVIVLDQLRAAKNFAQMRLVINTHTITVQNALDTTTRNLNDIMTFGGDSTLNLAHTSIAELITDRVQHIRQLHSKPDIHLTYQFESQTDLVMDRLKISRVIDNIVDNAFDACDNHGTIEIKTALEDKYLKITIANSGSHIPTSSFERLFDSFYTNGKTDGTGLGLAIARKYIEAHGGKIWCENLADGVAFHFTLPLSAANPSDVTPQDDGAFAQGDAVAGSVIQSHPVITSPSVILSEAKDLSQSPLKLLIVDDDLIYQDAILSLLQQMPSYKQCIQPILAETPEQALALFHEQDPDAVICDHDLGSSTMNGITLLKHMNQKRPDLPAIYLSNRMVAADVISTEIPRSAIHYVKPLTPRQLQMFLTDFVLRTSHAGLNRT